MPMKDDNAGCEIQGMPNSVSFVSNVPVFDKEELLDRVGQDEMLCQRVMQVFLNTMPKDMDTLKTALDENNAEQTNLTAHAIKGMSANVAAQRLKAIASEMEEAGEKKDLKKAVLLMSELEKNYEIFLSVLDASVFTDKTISSK